MQISSRDFIRVLIGFKVILLVSLLIYLSDDFYIGDKDLHASESKNDKKNEEVEKPTLKTDESTKKRKSFLSDLLNLPSISDIGKKNDEIGKYLSLAERKKQQVDKRIALLAKREELLKNIEDSIDEKLSRLEEERLFFSQTVQKEKEIKIERLENLVKFYGKMEPKKSGPIFEKLDKDLVVAMFKKMKQKRITLILESMTPDRSVELTEYYGRIKSGREYDLLKEMNVSLKKTFDDCKGMPAH